MLSPRYLENMPDEVVEIYSRAERDILADMARRISTYDYWIPAADWQNQKLLEAGRTQAEILRILSKATKKSVPELKKLMEQAAKDGNRVDRSICETAGKEVPTFEDSAALREILNAGYKATAQTMQNLTKTTARTATQQFERALDKAWMKVTSGAFSTDEAVRSAVKELCAQGVKSIRYPSGHEDTLEVAVRRAVVTGVNKTCGEMSMALIDELGCDLVEVSAHAGARTGEGVANHAEWQGKIYRLNRGNGVEKSTEHGIMVSDDDATIHSIDSPIEQRNTGRGKPSAITHYDVDLNTRQQKLLDSLPNYDSRVEVAKEDVGMTDLSALTAKTGDEFALFTKGGKRLVIRGNSYMVGITTAEAKAMGEAGYVWSGHTHPGTNKNCLIASPGDVEILKCFGQQRSCIYNSLGEYLDFVGE